jgi:hypothetical protein
MHRAASAWPNGGSLTSVTRPDEHLNAALYDSTEGSEESTNISRANHEFRLIISGEAGSPSPVLKNFWDGAFEHCWYTCRRAPILDWMVAFRR